MTRLALVALRLLDRALQWIVPVKGDRVCWVSDPDYVGNSFHLYRHMVTTRPHHEHVWLVVDSGAGERIQADVDRWADALAPGTTTRVVPRHSLQGYWAFLRSARTFHTHGTYRTTVSAHRRHIVSLWHGMPIKCIGALNKRSPNPHPTFGTVHVATSPFFRYVIAAAFRAPPEQVLLTSLPRCDVLVRPHPLAPSEEAIRARLGVPPGGRLVVWLPTYRSPGGGSPEKSPRPGDRSFSDDLVEEQWAWVDAAAGRHGCTVVLKLHPYDVLNLGGEVPDLAHVRFLRSPDWLATGIELYDLLAVADGLISDISSALIDHLVTDRPLGIIGFDPATYTRDLVFPVEPLLSSRRIHDLNGAGAVDAFFERVASGQPVTGDEDDLSEWLYDVPLETGCETVLAAAGLPARGDQRRGADAGRPRQGVHR